MQLTRLFDARNIILMGRKHNINITSMDDMPKLVEALQTWGQFESAQAYQQMYIRFLECRKKEMTDEVSE